MRDAIQRLRQFAMPFLNHAAGAGPALDALEAAHAQGEWREAEQHRLIERRNGGGHFGIIAPQREQAELLLAHGDALRNQVSDVSRPVDYLAPGQAASPVPQKINFETHAGRPVLYTYTVQT